MTESMLKKNVIAAGIVLLAAACGQPEGEAVKEENQQPSKVKVVEVTPMKMEPFTSYIDIQGKVDAEENVSVNAEMPGNVAAVNVQVGDQVSKGQVMAELDSKGIRQGIAELQTNLELAKTLYEKQKTLWDQKIGTEMQFLQAKTQKESLEKRMAAMNEQLEMTKFISPISGTVDAVDIKLGQATMPGLPAIRVVNMNSLSVKGEVAESYLAKVKTGNDAVIILPDLADTARAKISYAAKVISPLNRTFTITIRLNGKHDYHPNQVAVIKIIDYANPEALVVPVSAVQHSGGGDFVFVADGNKVKKVKVKVGRVYSGRAEITEGLKAGDKFITKGFQELNEGEEIKY